MPESIPVSSAGCDSTQTSLPAADKFPGHGKIFCGNRYAHGCPSYRSASVSSLGIATHGATQNRLTNATLA